MGDAAAAAGVSYWALRRATAAGHVPEPAHKVGRYRWYTVEEVNQISAYFDLRGQGPAYLRRLRDEGPPPPVRAALDRTLAAKEGGRP
jgi:hypothetical protein